MTSTTPAAEPGWRSLPVGARAVVRRRLAAGAGHVWTDLIGYVLEVSDAGLLLRTDPRPGRGSPEEVRVRAEEIETAKPVPERPVRRSGPPR
ncbi:DUF6725 family protein [Antribacter gilvus]|uniref:DUF6725 family protein n=1 Tax=Antribacter gilvus TaxID=2304675 RepID=UPI000F784B56|nr:DUF6725 family protein [Antribacter gilvus]